MPDEPSMTEQRVVAEFLDENEMNADPEYRLLDLAAEVGEMAADATKSSEYGDSPDQLSVRADELGDALFALLAVADGLDIDAGEALDSSVAKYERRITERGDAGSGK